MLAPWWQPDVVGALAGWVVSALAVAEGSAREISAKASVKRRMPESYSGQGATRSATRRALRHPPPWHGDLPGGRELVQKASIVRDDDDGARVRPECLLELLDRVEVEVV
jgi:hypothetical protein